MSKVEFKTIPSPATARDGDAVRENYEDLSTASQAVTNENIQRGSVFTRHLSDVDGPFKEIDSEVAVNSGGLFFNAGALAADLVLIATAPSPLTTPPGAPVLAVGKVPFAVANHLALALKSTCRIELQHGPSLVGPWTVFSRKDLSFFTEYRVLNANYTEEETVVELFGMFEAPTPQSAVRLVAIAGGNTNNFDFSGSATTTYNTQLTTFVINN